MEQVRQFYRLLGTHDYPGAWQLLSPGFQARTSYAEWAAGFEPTIAQTDQAETVALRVQVTDQTPSGPEERSFGGTWIVIQTSEGWRLDRSDIKRLT
jgi:hypothetical protein